MPESEKRNKFEIEYPLFPVSSSYNKGFVFPGKLLEEASKEFPDWGSLHEAIKGNDASGVCSLLGAYLRSLEETINARTIVQASEAGELDELVNHARKLLEVRLFDENLRQYLPQCGVFCAY